MRAFGGGSIAINRVIDAMMARRRGATEIIAEILAVASRGPVTKTSLVYRSNLNFSRVEKYLDFLLSRDLMQHIDSQPVSTYRTTEKGEEALRTLTDAERMIFGENTTNMSSELSG